MKTVGIICEYNPLHRGHQLQFEKIRQKYGGDSIIVCLMSGNYVQRGAPSIYDKSIRAEAALRCGADLVLELPIGACLSSAEGFAYAGVAILSKCCDILCFGTESMAENELWNTAKVLLSPLFPALLKEELDKGLSFPAARQSALEKWGIASEWVSLPNNILAVEYCKAILLQGCTMEIFPIHREGSYHAQSLDASSPSASAIRNHILCDRFPSEAFPNETIPLFKNAPVHTISAGERAIIAKLRAMEDAEFEALPFGSEGLWRKLMKAARSQNSLDAIINVTKSKRYTRSRIDRMILCAFLDLKESDLKMIPPYVRTLAFREKGREILHNHPEFRNTGETIDDPYQSMEERCGRLYGLFREDGIDAPDIEDRRRIVYLKEQP